jgi:hypothetical protein
MNVMAQKEQTNERRTIGLKIGRNQLARGNKVPLT